MQGHVGSDQRLPARASSMSVEREAKPGYKLVTIRISRFGYDCSDVQRGSPLLTYGKHFAFCSRGSDG